MPPGHDWVVHLTNSGSEAIDLALLMARASTGRMGDLLSPRPRVTMAQPSVRNRLRVSRAFVIRCRNSAA